MKDENQNIFEQHTFIKYITKSINYETIAEELAS